MSLYAVLVLFLFSDPASVSSNRLEVQAMPIIIGDTVVSLRFKNSTLSVGTRHPAHEKDNEQVLTQFAVDAGFMWEATPSGDRRIDVLFESEERGYFAVYRLTINQDRSIALDQLWSLPLAGSLQGIEPFGSGHLVYGRTHLYRIAVSGEVCSVFRPGQYSEMSSLASVGDRVAVRSHPGAVLFRLPGTGCKPNQVKRYVDSSATVRLVGIAGDKPVAIQTRRGGQDEIVALSWKGRRLGNFALPSRGQWSWAANVGDVLVVYDYSGEIGYLADGKAIHPISKPMQTHVANSSRRSDLSFVKQDSLPGH